MMKIGAEAEPMVEAVEGCEGVVETDILGRSLHKAPRHRQRQVKPQEATSPQDRLAAEGFDHCIIRASFAMASG